MDDWRAFAGHSYRCDAGIWNAYNSILTDAPVIETVIVGNNAVIISKHGAMF